MTSNITVVKKQINLSKSKRNIVTYYNIVREGKFDEKANAEIF